MSTWDSIGARAEADLNKPGVVEAIFDAGMEHQRCVAADIAAGVAIEESDVEDIFWAGREYQCRVTAREALTEGTMEGDGMTANLFAFVGDGNTNTPFTVSATDRADFDALPVDHSKDSVVLMDLTTHEFWRFRRADCGADCFCAARADRVTLKVAGHGTA